MLVPAISRKEEVLKKFSEMIYTEDYFYYCGYPHCHSIPEIKAEDDYFDWVSVDSKGEIIGYISYHINPATDNVARFGMISFDKGNPLFMRDVFNLLKDLVKNHRRVEWRCIGGNPVAAHYNKFCENCGGRVIALRSVVKGLDGSYRDEYIYEILNKEK